MSEKYKETLNKIRRHGGYIKENAIGKLVVDVEKTQGEYDADCLVLKEAVEKAEAYDAIISLSKLMGEIG